MFGLSTISPPCFITWIEDTCVLTTYSCILTFTQHFMEFLILEKLRLQEGVDHSIDFKDQEFYTLQRPTPRTALEIPVRL
jgi:hypothetical protein